MSQFIYNVSYNNCMATYDELFLALDNKLKIHQRHLQFLAIEIYNSKNMLNPSFMCKTYKKKNKECKSLQELEETTVKAKWKLTMQLLSV